ncbi:uncharacterized protein [Solanum lycopersicum]|uniref:uncharacterized protein n=1 Tax=Solanum lycopersicum TaxID=4081 RepID=UPI00374A8415
MNIWRTPNRRVEENDVQEDIPSQVEEIEPVPKDAQGDQVPNVEGGNDDPLELSNRDIREALIALARAMTTQVERLCEDEPFYFSCLWGEEDPQEFQEGVYKVLSAMGVISWEKAELASYQLRNVSQIWYTQWMDNRPEESGPIEWEEFKEAFLGKYFLCERSGVKVEDFINIKKDIMSAKEYSLKFSMLSRYTPSLVSNLKD